MRLKVVALVATFLSCVHSSEFNFKIDVNLYYKRDFFYSGICFGVTSSELPF